MTGAIFRCAIYTRVSDDAGLEQDFNSLDAQRESAEAYIKSQAHEGWRLVRDHFDDGGFSGGSMERPALQKLLERIQQGRIDIVVVYKVDRLTRSLADFAKLVDLFDARKVSFVSVTQAFNTTSSMGRLTLNVLLSFAQFEREVTGERIRDKIAASKKKGIWMGGVVPHGYRVEERKLLIVETEAAEVRLIFDLYLAHSSVRAVQRELRDRGVRTRKRSLSNGRTIGGIPFTNGPIAHILQNRHYLGEINHRGKSWPGEHAPIIDLSLFDRVAERLFGQRRFRLADRAKTRALLLGKIFNEAGERIMPSYALKKGVRYRYYISVSAMQSRAQSNTSLHRIPADAIETLVLDALGKMQHAGGASAYAPHPEHRVGAINATASTSGPQSLGSEPDHHSRDLVDKLLERVVVNSDRLEITCRSASDPDAEPTIIVVQWTKPPSKVRREILQPQQHHGAIRPMEGEEQTRLLRGIATARRWVDQLIAGDITDAAAIALREHQPERSVRRLLSLAFLDPALVQAAAEARLPRGYGVARLTDLPPCFDDQWKALGLARPR